MKRIGTITFFLKHSVIFERESNGKRRHILRSGTNTTHSSFWIICYRLYQADKSCKCMLLLPLGLLIPVHSETLMYFGDQLQGRRKVFCIGGAQNVSNVVMKSTKVQTLGELRMRSHTSRPRGYVYVCIKAVAGGAAAFALRHGLRTNNRKGGPGPRSPPVPTPLH